MTAQLLTAEQLADRWQVKEKYVWDLTRRGEIPHVKLGKFYRYRLDLIEAHELGQTMLPAAENGPATRERPGPRPKGARIQ